jgi:hypothetical protein
MLADIPTIIPGVMKGPDANAAIMDVVLFVESHLAEFPIIIAGRGIKDETRLNQELFGLLSYHTRKESRLFMFVPEDMEEVKKGNSPRPDFGVRVFPKNSEFYYIQEPFFTMEAKRLGQTDKNREKEYLIGREINGKYIPRGGVERFKLSIHGKKLQYAAMIGYIQAYDVHHWQKAINGWIDDLITGIIPSHALWQEKDKLLPMNQTPNTAKFRSQNSRSDDSIILFHLWVNL